MDIEFEATFPNTSHKLIKKIIKTQGGKLIKPRTLYRISVFFTPNQKPNALEFVRVRDEKDTITMTTKWQDGDEESITSQREIEIEIDNFNKGVAFLKRLGCKEKAYQERFREVWELDRVSIMLDEWPFLEPFIEIEGKDEKSVKRVAKKLKLDYKKAIFGGVNAQYSAKYNLSHDEINNNTPRITFDSNPFSNR